MVYAKYRRSGFDRDFFDIHAADIILHKAAKKYFDELKITKLPSINSLRSEWAELEKEHRKLLSGYKATKHT